MIALARSGSLLFFRAVTIDEGESPPASASHVPVLPATALLGLGLVMTIWAGPLHGLADAIAAQLLTPHEYIHAVLGGRP
jgi:formate hydrogenlyase subunit 3/multisubunit Na+/H+ antiporter MnhD subunit